MTSILKAIALVIIGGLMLVAFFFFAIWIVMFLSFVLVIFGIAYFGNVRFTVSKEGKKVGTYTRKGGFRPF